MNLKITFKDNAKFKKLILLPALLFLAAFLLRFFFILPTLNNHYTNNYYRIGSIPWSDAAGWYSGAEEIAQGDKLDEFAGRRPLYPLVLSILIALGITHYQSLIVIQILLISLSIVLVYYILRDVKEKFPVIIFLTFLILWRLNTPSVMMTENLAMIIFIIAFACIYKGFLIKSNRYILLACFLFAIGESVRPWAFLALLLLPLIPIFLYRNYSTKIKFVVIYTAFIIMGLSLHYFADMFFNKPHIGTNTNFSLTLYGQVNGGTGWGSVYTDKDIHERIKQGITPEELNRFIYKKAIKLFVAQPVNFIKASIETYKNYIKTIPADFRRNGRIGPFFFILIFSVFYILFLDGRQKGVLKNLYVKEKILFFSLITRLKPTPKLSLFS